MTRPSDPAGPGVAAILARLREDAHNETGQLGLYARELLGLLDVDRAEQLDPPAGPWWQECQRRTGPHP